MRQQAVRNVPPAAPRPATEVIAGLNWQFSAQRVYHQTVRMAKLSAIYTLATILISLTLAWLLRDKLLENEAMTMRFTVSQQPSEAPDG